VIDTGVHVGLNELDMLESVNIMRLNEIGKQKCHISCCQCPDKQSRVVQSPIKLTQD